MDSDDLLKVMMDGIDAMDAMDATDGMQAMDGFVPLTAWAPRQGSCSRLAPLQQPPPQHYQPPPPQHYQPQQPPQQPTHPWLAIASLEIAAQLREARERHAAYVDSMARRESNFLKDSKATEKALQTRIKKQQEELDEAKTTLRAITAERSQREDEMTCVICMEFKRDVLPPCGHLSMCGNCAQANTPKKCPVCRKVYSMKSVRKIFYS